MIEKVSLAAKFELFDQYWSPRIIGELNDLFVKVVKVKGAFVWHSHPAEDELFYIASRSRSAAMHFLHSRHQLRAQPNS